MKCRVHYEIDGEPDYFDVEERDVEKCRIQFNSRVKEIQ